MKKLLEKLKFWASVKIALHHHKEKRKYQLYRRRMIIRRWKDSKERELYMWALGAIVGDTGPMMRYEYIKNMERDELASFIADARAGGCRNCPLAMECVYSSCEDAHAAWLNRAMDIREVK